jgi:hypothetical protein
LPLALATGTLAQKEITMKGKYLALLRLLLLSVCLSHLALGLGLNFSSELPKTVAPWYGATKVEWTPQFLYILKPVGAYMIAMGLLAAVAMLSPRKHSAIVFGIAVLLILRGLQRLVFQQDIVEAFGVSTVRNLINAGFFAGLGAMLVVLRLGAGSSST